MILESSPFVPGAINNAIAISTTITNMHVHLNGMPLVAVPRGGLVEKVLVHARLGGAVPIRHRALLTSDSGSGVKGLLVGEYV